MAGRDAGLPWIPPAMLDDVLKIKLARKMHHG
jgi:hypothetical protein